MMRILSINCIEIKKKKKSQEIDKMNTKSYLKTYELKQ